MLVLSLTLLLFVSIAMGQHESIIVDNNDMKRDEDASSASWRKSLHIQEATTGGWPYPFAVNRTEVRCCNNTVCIDALSNGQWCQSGVACIATFCYIIPNYPCATQVETCDETNHKCIPRPCTTHSQCDDGLFCNGKEKCVRNLCVPGIETQCNGGICDETLKQCSYPNLFNNWLNFSATNQQLSLDSFFSLKHFNSTTGSGFPDSWTIWVIAVVGVIIFMVVVVLIVSMVNKNTVVGPVAGGTYFYKAQPQYF